MLEITAVLIVIATIVYVFGVRSKDLPEPEAPSPTKHLEERKATIYENLRDLQFEYRVGKLSDPDYQATKTDLQKELATVLAEIDRVTSTAAKSAPKPAPAPKKTGLECPHCSAKLPKPMKFCGECGKPLPVEV